MLATMLNKPQTSG